jgi:hypothetical protein
MKRLLIGLLALAALVAVPSATLNANLAPDTITADGHGGSYGTGGG